jgi:hypothetical protein
VEHESKLASGRGEMTRQQAAEIAGCACDQNDGSVRHARWHRASASSPFVTFVTFVV